MLLGLPSSSKPLLEMTSVRVDHQYCAISLSSACDHVSDEVLVAGVVKDSVLPLGGVEAGSADVNCDSALLFFFGAIENIGVEERALAYALSLFLVSMHFLLADFALEKQHVTHES